MVHYAGAGIALQNTVPKLKEATNMIVLSNNKDGIINLLNNLVVSE